MAEAKNLEGKKIFLVEDDNLFANMMLKKLENNKCIFLYAKDGEEAVVKIPESKPDVVLLDLMLPGKYNGFDVLEQLKKDSKTKDIPVIIVSNMSDSKDIDKGVSLGAYRFLVKAFVTLDEIVENLQAAVSGKAA